MSGSNADGLVIVDSGGANLGSVLAAFHRLGLDPPVTADPAVIADAQRILLPGVGAAAPIMQRLRAHGVVDLLRQTPKPLLGICVGMQVLFEHSEEGDVRCLGLLSGHVQKMRGAPGMRVPHMGWNRLRRERDSALLEGLEGGHAYFVHSYAAAVGKDCVASVEHGQAYTALVQRGNVAGAQFHPERSGELGARLLTNFMQWTPDRNMAA